MSDDQSDRTLPLGDAHRLDALRSEFERASRSGTAPRIEDFLKLVEEALRPATFSELLKVEIALRLARQETVRPEDYLARFPVWQSAIHDFCRPFELLDTIILPPRNVGSGLHVRCPHCHNAIELVPEAELESIQCGSCGSNFSLTSDEAEPGANTRGVVKVGHFELKERLGMGAFGTVWKAKDTELDRVVAVKVPRAGQLDKQRQEQFIREARAAAQLRHPNIVPVYEVGREADRLYIVSEFIRGSTLDEWHKAQPLSARSAAIICAKIAVALHHAHEQGIIHRDLKPANVMVDEASEPHIMDFGLARREAGEITMTIEGQLLGTPAYMSPEQARGDAHNADARSDVYSLGVMLFELLTGELPFRGSPRMLLKQVIEDEPPRLRKFSGTIPRDLETITLKCLEKSPSKRYGAATDLADDLRRFLTGETVKARPVGRPTHAWRWCKRNPFVAASLAIGAVLIAALALSLREQIAQQALSTKRLRYARHEKFNLALAQAASLLDDRSGNVRAYLEDVNLCPYDLRDFSWRLLGRRADGDEIATTLRHTTPVTLLRFSPDGKQLAAGIAGKLILWDIVGGNVVRTLNTPVSPLKELQYSHDGSLLFVCYENGQAWLVDSASGRTVFDFAAARCVLGPIPQSTVQLTSANLPDEGWGKSIAHFDPTNDSLIAEERSRTPRPASSSTQDGEPTDQAGDRSPFLPLDERQRIRRRQQQDGELMFLVGRIVSGAFTKSSRELVTAHEDGRILAWQIVPYGERTIVDDQTRAGIHIGSMDVILRARPILSQSRGRALRSLRTSVENGEFWALSFDGAVERCSLGDPPTVAQVFLEDGVAPQDVAPNGRFSAMTDAKLPAIFDVSTNGRELVLEDPGPVRWTALSSDGRALAVAPQSGDVFIHPSNGGDDVPEHLTGLRGADVCSMEFSPDGNLLACGVVDGRVLVWDRTTRGFRESFENAVVGATIVAVDASPTNRYCVSVSAAGDANVWDLAAGAVKTTLRSDGGALLKALMTNDDAFVVGLDNRGCVFLWDLSGTLLARHLIPGADSLVRNSDSTQFAIGSGSQWHNLNLQNGEITLAPWTEAWSPREAGAMPDGIAFSTRGHGIAAFTIDARAADDGERYTVYTGPGTYSELPGVDGSITVQYWDWLDQSGGADQHISLSGVPPYPVLRGGPGTTSSLFAVAGASQMAAMGNLVYRPDAETPFVAVESDIVANAFSADERLLITLSSEGVLQMWDPLTLSLRPTWNRATNVKSAPPIRSFAMSWDGSLLVLGHVDGLVTVLNAGDLLTENVRSGSFGFSGFVNDGRTTVTTVPSNADDHIIEFTDIESGEVVDRWHGPERWNEKEWETVDVVYSANARYMAEIATPTTEVDVDDDGADDRMCEVRVFDVGQQQQESACRVAWRHQHGNPQVGELVAVSNDGTRIAFDANDTITVMEASGEVINEIRADFGWLLDEELRTVAFTNNENLVIFDVDANRKYATPAEVVRTGTANPLLAWQASRFSPDGSLLAIWEITAQHIIVNVKALHAGERPHAIVITPSVEPACAFSDDNRQFANESGVYDVSTGQLLHQFSREGGVDQLAFHPNGELLFRGNCLLNISHPPAPSRLNLTSAEASTTPASDDGNAIVDSAMLREAEDARPTCGMSTDGKWFAAAVVGPDLGHDYIYQKSMFPCTFIVWNLASGDSVTFEVSLGVDLEGYGEVLNWLCVSNNGQRLALRGYDNRLWIVDAASHAVTNEFQNDIERRPEFSADGNVLLYDGERLDLDISTSQWLDRQVRDSSEDQPTREYSGVEGYRIPGISARFHSELADNVPHDELERYHRHLVLRRDSSDGDELLRLVFGADGRWLAITPDGRYEASDEGRVDWALFSEPTSGLNVPLELLRDGLHTPGLLQDILNGQRTGENQPVYVRALKDAVGDAAVYGSAH